MDRIVYDPQILHGKPIIKGTRISVELILQLLYSGMSIDDILQEYPHLHREDVLAAIEFATKSLQHGEIFSLHEILQTKPKAAKV